MCKSKSKDDSKKNAIKSATNLEILREQRNILVEGNKELNGNMFKVIVAIIPLIAAMMASYVKIIDVAYGPVIRFGIFEIILILSMVISACLFAENINRDYIAAIDEYALKEFGISEFVFEGELSLKHLTGIIGVFPLMTFLIGFSTAFLVILFLFYIVYTDYSFYTEHIYLPIIVAVQLIFYLIIICLNIRRKMKKASSIFEDCLNHLNRKK